MTSKKAQKPAKQPPAKPALSQTPIIVFGLDPDGKSKGARFLGKEAELAVQAARSLELKTCEATSTDLQALAKRLPSGRVYAKGRAFIPFIKRELYDMVAAAADVSSALAVSQLPPPSHWDGIAPGHIVLARTDDPDEGWFETVVLEREGDALALRFRDFPREKSISRHISAIALLNPSAG